MATVPKPRDIIDRKALLSELDGLVGWSGYTPKTQSAVLDVFKAAHQKGWDEVRRRFEDRRASSRQVARANAYLIDQLVRSVYDFALKSVYPAANPTTGELLAITATGGYGRGELAPFSDIDLMFVLPYKLTPHSEQVVEFMLYTLWDLGLKVGHATRSIDEAIRLAKADLTIRTSLLEARWIWGDKAMVEEFKRRFRADVAEGSGHDFVEAKLAERDARHDRMGDTRYVLEPNIKEGKGGLRDLQTLFWIAKYLYGVDDVAGLESLGVLTKRDIRLFAKAEKFLWTVRCHLHYLSGRPEERLTFNVQNEIAQRMAYADRSGVKGVERFMKHYFLIAKDVGDLTRILCAVLEDQQKKDRTRWLPSLPFRRREVDGFAVDGDRITVPGADVFKADPVKMLALFETAQRHDLDIHPSVLRLVRQNLKLIGAKVQKDAEANRLFLAMLSGPNPEKTLMRLNEAGVFGRFVPDFGRVVAQMQYDMYHVYTVDEHTIRAIGILKGIETGKLKDDHPASCAIVSEVQSLRVLYVAVLLHDIAKGRGGDHSEIGADIALKLCPRFGLNEWETETVSWLVRYHLLMSHTAFKRDVYDPKTAGDLAEIVQSPERLRLLLILTVADIRAVGPGVWNAWKAGLLRELYYRAQEVLSGGVPEERRAERVERARADLAERLADWPEAERSAHLERGFSDYWLAFDGETLVRHATMIRDAEATEHQLHIETRVDEDRDVTEVLIYTPDHPGLFVRIAGALSLAGASVVDAKIMTLANGMALDTFWIQDADGRAIAIPSRLERLTARVRDSLSGVAQPGRELEDGDRQAMKSRTGVFKVPPRVLIDNKASNRHTVIEINGRDRPGFLHDVTDAITRAGLQISSAHISTYGERVVDVFYVRDVFGLKIERADRLDALREELLAAVSPEGDAPRSANGGKGGPKKPPAKADAPRHEGIGAAE